jgi:hypothetical protein
MNLFPASVFGVACSVRTVCSSTCVQSSVFLLAVAAAKLPGELRKLKILATKTENDVLHFNLKTDDTEEKMVTMQDQFMCSTSRHALADRVTSGRVLARTTRCRKPKPTRGVPELRLGVCVSARELFEEMITTRNSCAGLFSSQEHYA